MISEYLKQNSSVIQRAQAFNNKQLEIHSISSQGVGWNSPESQSIRYEQLLRILPEDGATITINDVGCGYGFLWNMLSDNKNIGQYRGYDISTHKLVTAAREDLCATDDRVKFHHLANIDIADYSVASGIFGMKFDFDPSQWHEYIVNTLDLLDQYSRVGFAFNMLTSYSDLDKLRDELYYADPCRYFDICKRKYARNVALLHDYELYDFTILVRKA